MEKLKRHALLLGALQPEEHGKEKIHKERVMKNPVGASILENVDKFKKNNSLVDNLN